MLGPGTNMSTDPLSIALREIIETTELLESLVLTSESFDYFRAKSALKELNRKVRELSRVRARFESMQSPNPTNVYVLDFKSAKAPAPTEP